MVAVRELDNGTATEKGGNTGTYENGWVKGHPVEYASEFVAFLYGIRVLVRDDLDGFEESLRPFGVF